MDSLGAGVIKTGRIYAPNCCRHCQEAPKRILAMPAVFLHFFVNFLQREGVWGGLSLFHRVHCCWGALEGKMLLCGSCPPACSGTFGCSGLSWGMGHHSGVIERCVADVEDAEMCFQVDSKRVGSGIEVSTAIGLTVCACLRCVVWCRAPKDPDQIGSAPAPLRICQFWQDLDPRA